MINRQKLLRALPEIERYASTVLAIVCTTALRLVFEPMLENRAPYLFFVLAVVMAKRLWGTGPGLLATLLGGISAWYFILPPQFSFYLANRAEALNLAAFLGIGASISLLGEMSWRAPASFFSVRGRNIKVRAIRQTLVLAGAAVVLAGTALLLMRDFRRTRDAEGWVVHTYQVINAAETLRSNLEHAEAGQRSFLLTGDQRYLARYNAAVAALTHPLQELKNLTTDNRQQQARCVRMSGLVDERLALLKRGIELRKASGAEAALTFVRTRQGDQLMEILRAALDDAVSEERRLLGARTAEAESRASRARWILGLGGLALVLLLVFASVIIELEAARREEITQALQRHAHLLEQSHDCLFTWPLGGAINYWSRGAENLLGYTREEALGRSSHDLLLTSHPLSMSQIYAMLERDGHWNGELTQTTKDGRKVTVEAQWTLAVDTEGNKTVLEANRDITERKRAEEARRESEAQFRTLANAIPQLCWMANADGWIFWYNERWYEYTGTTPEQMEGWGWQSVHDPEALPKVMECWKESLATGKPFDMIFPLRGADGAFRPFLTRVMPVCDREGKVARWFGTNTDISEQRKAEAALRESEAILRSFFDSSGVMRGMVELIDGRITHISCNEAAAQLFGVDAKSIAGKTATETGAAGGVAQAWVALYEKARSTGSPVSGEYARVDAEGRERWLLATASYMGVGRAGNPRFAYTILDLTDRKRAEEALLQSETRLRVLSDNLPAGAIYHYRHDAQGRPHVDFISAGIEQLTGVPAAEFMADAETVNRNIVPEDRERMKAAILLSRENLTRFEVEIRHPHRVTGEVRWSLLRSTPTRCPDGSTVWDGIELDITERKRTEDALRESEAHLQFALETGQMGEWELDVVDNTALRSLRHDRIFGYETLLPEWSYERFLEHVVPEDRALVDRKFRHAIETGSEWNFECRIVRRDQATRWIWARGRPRWDDNGKMRWLAGILEDITERRQVEAERILLSTAIEQAAETVVVTHRDGKIQYVNPAFTRTTGYTHDEAIGQNPRVLKSGQHDAKFYQQLWATIAAGRIWRGELTNRRKDGTLYTEEATIAPVRDASGETTNYIAIKSDITERKQAEKALRQSEAHFRSLFDNMLNGYAYCRMHYQQDQPDDFIYLSVNKAFEDLTGLKNVAGKKVSEVIPGIQEADPELFEIYGRVASTGVPARFETYVEALAMWFSIAVYSPKKEHFVAVFDVITERKEAEEALKQSERRERERAAEFEALMEAAPVGIFKSDDAECKTMSGNRAAYELLRRPRGSNLSKSGPEGEAAANFRAMKDGKDIPLPELPMQKAAVTGHRVRDHEMDFVFEDGATVNVLGNAVALLDESGRPRGAVGAFVDITRLKQADLALAESERRYRELFERSESALGLYEMVFDAEGKPCDFRFLDVNPAWERLIGLSRSQVLGHRSLEMTPGLEGYWIETFGQVAATGEPATFELYARPLGRYYAGTAYSPRPHQVAVTFMDVTERIRAEEALHQLNIDLEKRVRARTAALELANRELESFAHSVSHDLRAPLRGIDGWSQALLEDYGGQLDAQGQKYLGRVRSEAQRMGMLIDDLLHLSRVARAQMVPGIVDLTCLVETIIGRLKEAHAGRCIEFIVEPQLKCVGDPRLLEVALTNLLDNAVKFTGRCNAARVEFGQTEREGKPAFFVRDNGAGFDMAYVGNLFAPFQRLHKAVEFPGTGIGLATVQRVIHRHGGRIWAEARVGAEATFYFTLGENKP